MPNTHKRVPFSAKQKKEQLKAKRERKKNQTSEGDDPRKGQRDWPRKGVAQCSTTSDSEESNDSTSNKPKIAVNKLNQQPISKTTKGYDPNRYKLHFRADTDETVKVGALISRQPIQILPEESLEIDIDEIYRPGTELDMPKRPTWNYNMARKELDDREERYFKNYVEEILAKFPNHELSYFELNLETWRQLWRVTEMSDIILLITDIRHPALHFSPTLYHYVVDDLKKHMILVLNKIDVAPPSVVISWREYFRAKFPRLHIVCFTSYPKDDTERSLVNNPGGQNASKTRRRRTFTAAGPMQLLKACEDIVQGRVELSSWKQKLEELSTVSVSAADNTSCTTRRGEMDAAESTEYKEYQMYSDGMLTIGCCGYPNVGKSTLINGLVGKKVVSVSRTPGHTKHFQTIFLTPTVKLCDCPGVVFPSLVTRPLQILSGIFPIAQVREPYTSIRFLAERVPVPELLKLKHPELESRPDLSSSSTTPPSWSAFYICDAWAEKRGFLTAKAGRNDTFRAANHILRMATQGLLCLCMRPPNYYKNRAMWLSHADTEELGHLQTRHRHALDSKYLSADEEDDDEESGSEEEEEGGGGGVKNIRQRSEDEEDEDEDDITSSNPFSALPND